MSVSVQVAEVMSAASVTFEEAAGNVQLAMQPVVKNSCRDFKHMCQVVAKWEESTK